MLPTNEFSRRLVIDPWPDAGINVDVTADPEEREALARRFDLVEVRSLRGRGRIERLEHPVELVFRGCLEADVVQTCVVTLEPVPAAIRRAVVRRYRPDRGPGTTPERLETGILLNLDEEDEIEPLSGREIDLGEALAEELGLSLDPYPHALGAAAVEAGELGPHVSLGLAEPSKPFAALRQLREKGQR